MVVAIVVGAALGVSQARVSEHHQARPNSPHFMRVGEGQFATSLNAVRTGEPAGVDGLNQEIYSNQAYPALTIAPAQRQAAAAAAAKIKSKPAKKKAVAAGCWSARRASRHPRRWPASPPPERAGPCSRAGRRRSRSRPPAPRRRARCCWAQPEAASGRTDNAMGKKPSGSSPTGRFPPTRSARSRTTRTTRPARRSTSAPASRTARATPRPASACTSRWTAARPGRASSAASRRRRPARTTRRR